MTEINMLTNNELSYCYSKDELEENLNACKGLIPHLKARIRYLKAITLEPIILVSIWISGDGYKTCSIKVLWKPRNENFNYGSNYKETDGTQRYYEGWEGAYLRRLKNKYGANIPIIYRDSIKGAALKKIKQLEAEIHGE